MPATQIVKLPGPFQMRSGGVLPEVEIAYETWGEPTPEKDNVLLLFTGLSPRAHAKSSPLDRSPGWWEEMIGPDHAIDTHKYYVICVNNLGSCFGSTGAASVNPATGETYGLDFPTLHLEDIAQAAHDALKVLGFDRCRAVVGPSLGGMTALAYAVMFPQSVGALISISAAPRCLPFGIAIHSLQREAIRTDVDWKEGRYGEGRPELGMRLARKIGMLSYRSAEEWTLRFGRERSDSWTDEPFGIEFEVETYLESHAQKFIHAFDPNCYLYLSRAMDIFDLAEHGGSLEAALGRVRARRILIMGVDTDILFPLAQQRELAAVLRRLGQPVEFAGLPSIQGHDAFLVDVDRFSPKIAKFLSDA